MKTEKVRCALVVKNEQLLNYIAFKLSRSAIDMISN